MWVRAPISFGTPNARNYRSASRHFHWINPGAGIPHHVTWRVADERALQRMRAMLAGDGYDITPTLDRHYYRAAYCQAPGGLRFALATEEPGFLIDEPAETLGSTLRLPPWLQLVDGKVIGRSPKRRR